MDPLRQLVGAERALADVSQRLCFFAKGLGASVVGAMHVTCADESELECSEAFQHGFVQYLLPPLKFARRSPFRLANLGGRYEWGAVRIAEDHYPAPPGGFKLLMVKVNSHVAFEELPLASSDGAAGADPSFRFGSWHRYGRSSTSCGALAALLAGARQPFTDSLRELFLSEGRDRVATLTNDVDEPVRALYAAIVSARLQARTVVLDVQDHRPDAPTFFVVVPCVTINRLERDTEIVCGVYTIDGREGGRDALYFGLGDDPGAYRHRVEHGRFQIWDDETPGERAGRDHRALIREQWRRARQAGALDDARLERVHRDVARNKHRNHHHAKALLRASLPILAEVAPVPAAILMFGEGAAGIHHAYKVHRLAREMTGTEEAREILDEIHAKVDELEPDRAEALIEVLMGEYRA